MRDCFVCHVMAESELGTTDVSASADIDDDIDADI